MWKGENITEQKYPRVSVVGLFYRSGIKRAALYGVVFAVSQCFMYFAYAASFTYGAYLVTQGLGFQDVFRYTL